jgi:hypothetical protein
VRAKLLSLALAALSASCGGGEAKETNKMLDEARARQYAETWAKKAGDRMEQVKKGEGGDFFGPIGSLAFDYSAKDQALVVRAYLQPYSKAFCANPDVLPWLNRIAAEKPESVSRGVFETLTPRWEPEKQPSLFLRIDITDGSAKESAVLARLLKMRDDAMVWKGSKLTDALDAMVKAKRAAKGQR